jgi:hypothetical protein
MIAGTPMAAYSQKVAALPMSAARRRNVNDTRKGSLPLTDASYHDVPGQALGQDVCRRHAHGHIADKGTGRDTMATTKQVQAAKSNIGKAQKAARRKRTLANLPAETRRDMGRQAAKARGRGGEPGHSYEDRSRQQLYEVAKKRGIPGRSRMGKWELIEALRKS